MIRRAFLSAVVVVMLSGGCMMASGTPQVEIEPSCIEPGETATLTVRTAPGAFVMYLTRYADGRSGAAEPFGAGYGGNDGGRADDEGRYLSSWTVSSDAPNGPVTVEIFLPEEGHGDAGPVERPGDAGAELEGRFMVSGGSDAGC